MAKKRRRAARRSTRSKGMSAGAIVGIVIGSIVVLALVVTVIIMAMKMNQISSNTAYMQGQKQVYDQLAQQRQAAIQQQRAKAAKEKADWDQTVDTGKNVLAIYGVVRAVQDIQANSQ